MLRGYRERLHTPEKLLAAMRIAKKVKPHSLVVHSGMLLLFH